MNRLVVALALAGICAQAPAEKVCGLDKTGDEPVWRCTNKKVVTVHGGTRGNSKHDIDSMMMQPNKSTQSKTVEEKPAQKSIGQ
ncbi:hypothetical protein [Caballeronia sp. 15711]|uniref:hypothetical protein n=1 Tax=Caballeronia sp. 15711 TaxID=3391029 RepID=UPI0039E649FC